MKSALYTSLLSHWPRKLVALLTATAVWFLVNHSITTSRTLANVPVRVLNVPPDKTIEGMLPDQTLSRRISLTLNGAKSALEQLDSGEIEVVLDATGKGDEWVADIGKKNLVSRNPDVDLYQSVSSVDHTDFVVKLSQLITAKIPIRINMPMGEAPQGYQYLGTWPPRLSQTVSGPEEQVRRLRGKGLQLTFDLDHITADELDRLEASQGRSYEDEVRYLLPNDWKRVAIPFLDNTLQPINDPASQRMRIEFLRKELLPLPRNLPINVFYPHTHSDTINPDTYKLVTTSPITKIHGIPHLQVPLWTKGVSRLFLEVVSDHLMLTIIAKPRSEAQQMDWTVQVINRDMLEDEYVEKMRRGRSSDSDELQSRLGEEFIRKRFREYMRALELYEGPDRPLNLNILLEASGIDVRAPALQSKESK